MKNVFFANKLRWAEEQVALSKVRNTRLFSTIYTPLRTINQPVIFSCIKKIIECRWNHSNRRTLRKTPPEEYSQPIFFSWRWAFSTTSPLEVFFYRVYFVTSKKKDRGKKNSMLLLIFNLFAKFLNASPTPPRPTSGTHSRPLLMNPAPSTGLTIWLSQQSTSYSKPLFKPSSKCSKGVDWWRYEQT